jgi:hypothetical protein
MESKCKLALHTKNKKSITLITRETLTIAMKILNKPHHDNHNFIHRYSMHGCSRKSVSLFVGVAKSKEQRAKSKEQRAKSKEQRAKSKEERAKSKEQRGKSKEQRVKSKE